MIILTRIRGGPLALNDEQIETMEETPDTVITMLNGHRYVVQESVSDIIANIESFRRNCSRPIGL